MPSDAVSEIRNRLDIVDVIGEKVALKRAGRNFKGLCPFHQEKTPSFVVFPESQNFHCFGCGKGGDLFTFYMESEKVEFLEALKDLADRAGVALESMPAQPSGPDPQRTRFLELHRIAATYYANILRNSKAGEKGREYLRGRGVDEAMIERFELGLAPDGWDFLLKQLAARGIDPESAVEAGLLQRRDTGGYYDRFRDRVMFPIHDGAKEIVAFGARAFGDDQPKYLNSPQSAIFDKSHLLYGLPFARDKIRSEDRVVIVEGYMDVISAHQFGFENVVGSMGTALTEAQVDLVRRATKRVVLALDADIAGQTASIRAIETLQSGLDQVSERIMGPRGFQRIAQRLDAEVNIAELETDQDPDSLIRSSPDRWVEFIERARPYVAFFIDHVLSEMEHDDAASKSRAVARLAPILQRIADPIQRDHYVLQLSRQIDLSYTRVQSIVRQTSIRPSVTALPGLDPSAASRAQLRTEDHLVALALRYPLVVGDLIEDLPETMFSDSRNRQIMTLLKRVDIDTETDSASLLASLDEPIADFGRAILTQLGGHPSPMAGEVREDMLQSVVKLQREQYDALSSHLRSELQDAQSSNDVSSFAELKGYLARLPELHQQLYPRRSPYFRDSRSQKTGRTFAGQPDAE